jgi:hypothetical protein
MDRRRNKREQVPGAISRKLIFLALLISDAEDGGNTSSETSIYIRTTRRYIQEDGNINNYRGENLKSYLNLSLESALECNRHPKRNEECGLLGCYAMWLL